MVFASKGQHFLREGKVFLRGGSKEGGSIFSGGHHLSEIRKSSTHKKITAESSSKHHSEIRICIETFLLEMAYKLSTELKPADD